MRYFNYHTHTLYCDGWDTPETFIKEAINRNMSAIGFSSHAPLSIENDYCISENKLDVYKTKIRNLQKKYHEQIDVFLGLEIDYIPGILDDFSVLQKQLALDYIIGSVHLVKEIKSGNLWFIDGPEKNYIKGLSDIFQNNIKLAVQKYFEQVSEMISLQKPTIVGHIDKVKMNNKGRFFSEDEPWYKDLLLQTLKVASNAGCIIEVNTRGIYRKRSGSLYPGIIALQEIYRLNIPVTVNSDSHKPDELTSYFPETMKILKNIGFKKIKCFNGKIWEDHPI
jgi:histidinol-phosphatase (PHP family)